MRLTPLDIKKQEFKRVMRGVDAEEVQAFLEMVADQWQDLLDEQNKLEHKITELDTKLEHYKQVEEALQEAVKTARESSRQTLEAAKTKAQSIIDAATESADQLHHRAQEDQYDLRRDIESLRSRRRETIARLRNLMRTELELLDDFDRQFPIPVEPDLAVEPEPVVGPEPAADPEPIDLTIPSQQSGQPDMREEYEAVRDIEELEAVASPDDRYDLDGADRSDDTLMFTADDGVPEESAADGAGPAQPHGSKNPAPPRESHRDSTEMDKIRKILDDLA